MKRTPLRRATPLKRRAQKLVQRLANQFGGHVTIRTFTKEGRKLAELKATPEKKRRKRLKIRIRKRDVEWARAVKERDGFICRYCRVYAKWGSENMLSPKPRGLHAAHIFGRSRKVTRHDLDNGLSLCMSHHLFLHAHPVLMVDFAKLALGEAKFESLRRRAMGIETHATRCNDRDCPQCGVDSCYDTEGSPEERTPSLDAQRRDALRR